MLDGEITSVEYKEIESNITNSRRELNKLSNTLLNIHSKIYSCINLLSIIENLYKKRYSNKATYNRLDIPKNLILKKKSVRILEVNRVVCLILNTGNTSEKSKKEKHTDFGVLSCGDGLH